MTCGFCHYEFCWACGASASVGERHFDAGNGCGVYMMDENIKPGDHLKIRKSRCRRCCRHSHCPCNPTLLKMLKWIGIFLFFPVVFLVYINYTILTVIWNEPSEACCSKSFQSILAVIGSPILTAIATIFFYAMCAIMLVFFIMVAIGVCFVYLCGGRCNWDWSCCIRERRQVEQRQNNNDNRRLHAELNRQRAQ